MLSFTFLPYNIPGWSLSIWSKDNSDWNEKVLFYSSVHRVYDKKVQIRWRLVSILNELVGKIDQGIYHYCITSKYVFILKSDLLTAASAYS